MGMSKRSSRRRATMSVTRRYVPDVLRQRQALLRLLEDWYAKSAAGQFGENVNLLDKRLRAVGGIDGQTSQNPGYCHTQDFTEK